MKTKLACIALALFGLCSCYSKRVEKIERVEPETKIVVEEDSRAHVVIREEEDPVTRERRRVIIHDD